MECRATPRLSKSWAVLYQVYFHSNILHFFRSGGDHHHGTAGLNAKKVVTYRRMGDHGAGRYDTKRAFEGLWYGGAVLPERCLLALLHRKGIAMSRRQIQGELGWAESKKNE